MNILVINCGSSSLKFQVINAESEKLLAKGLCERIGMDGSCITYENKAHRIVHGGEKFTSSVVITDEVIEAIKEVSDLAPLHNPANLIGVDACMSLMPGTPMVAVFDTAFHQTMPEKAYMYALPLKYYRDYKVRRYGFHGTSHSFVSKEAAKVAGRAYDDSYATSATAPASLLS